MPNQLVPKFDLSTRLAAAAAQSETVDPQRAAVDSEYRRRYPANWAARAGLFVVVLAGGWVATSQTWGLLPAIAGLWAAVYAALRLDQRHTHYEGFVEGYSSARESRPPSPH